MANLAIPQGALLANPYDDASFWESFRRSRHLKHPEKVNRCFLSGQDIEIPSREFTIQNKQGRVDYDIYRLAVHILKGLSCKFPGSDADFERFLKTFNLEKMDFTSLWDEAVQAYIRFERRLDDTGARVERVSAPLRLSLFAYRIPPPQRSILSQYTKEIIPEKVFKETYVPPKPSC